MSVVISHSRAPRRAAAARQLLASPWAWAVVATLFLIIATLAGPGPSLTDWLGDTDDAVRLVGVRELIAGAPWFDTTLPRIGAPDPLVSHWSRLIDLPLSVLIGMLSPALGTELAELATRMAWPALLFLALAVVVAREAERRAGLLAAAFALVLVTTSAMALAQFRPGRIDHHNAQILCAVAGLLLLVRSLDDRRAGWIAGALLGLGLSIGYEAMALVLPGIALAGLVAACRRDATAGSGVARAAAAATGALCLAMLATIPPARWLDVRCDALSLNLVALAACGATGLWAATTMVRGRIQRLGALALSAGIGATIYAGLEPACLAGPFGQVDPALKAVWLDQVMETMSVLRLAARHPAAAWSAVLFVLAGVAAQVALWWRRGDVQSGLAAALVVLAAALGCWQIKLLPYACWLAAVPLAVWAAQLRGTATISTPLMRAAAVVLLSQATLDAALGTLLSPFQPAIRGAPTEVDAADPRRPCFLTHNVRRLAGLPAGLVSADIDLGPYIVALTPHRVVAAPYHRLAAGILANEAMLNAPPEQARARLEALGVGYVALCADQPQDSARGAHDDGSTSLRTRLLAGQWVGFLQEVTLPADAGIKVWKVARLR